MAEAQAAARVDARRWFHHWMALMCLAISLIGFTPTYFAPLAQVSLSKEPIIHLHGFLFFAWTVYVCLQTWLAATGRVPAHREWGLLGVALATAMAFSVFAVDVMRLNQTPPEPASAPMLHVLNMGFFAACIAAALANVRRPETHKRLMLLATISLMGAPIGRWYVIALSPFIGPQMIAALNGPQPPDAMMLLALSGPILLSCLLLVAPAMVFDWRTHGRVSLIYAAGAPVCAAIGPASLLLPFAPIGQALNAWLKGFGG